MGLALCAPVSSVPAEIPIYACVSSHIRPKESSFLPKGMYRAGKHTIGIGYHAKDANAG